MILKKTMTTMSEMNLTTKTDPIRIEETALIEKASSAITVLTMLDGTEEKLEGKAENLLDLFCKKNGSSLKGRIDAAKYLVQAKTKFPVLIRERDYLIFFPLMGYETSQRNHWVNDSALVMITGIGREETELLFHTGLRLVIPYDIRMVRRQRELCERYRNALSGIVERN